MSPMPQQSHGNSFAQLDADRVLRVGGFGNEGDKVVVFSAKAASELNET